MTGRSVTAFVLLLASLVVLLAIIAWAVSRQEPPAPRDPELVIQAQVEHFRHNLLEDGIAPADADLQAERFDRWLRHAMTDLRDAGDVVWTWPGRG